MANKKKENTQVSVAPKISETDAERLEEHYRTRNRGAQESCHFWPIARQAVIDQMKMKRIFTPKESEVLNELDVPRDCDRTMLLAMVDAKKMKVGGRIRSLDDVEIIVLVDLIQNESVDMVLYEAKK